MLLGDIVLLVDVALEGGKDLPAAEEAFAGHPLEPQKLVVGVPVRVCPCPAVGGRDDKVLELLAEDDDALLEEERVGDAVVPDPRLDEGVLGGEEPTGFRRRAVEVVGRLLPEVEHEAEGPGVELTRVGGRASGREEGGRQLLMLAAAAAATGCCEQEGGARTSTPYTSSPSESSMPIPAGRERTRPFGKRQRRTDSGRLISRSRSTTKRSDRTSRWSRARSAPCCCCCCCW